MGRRNRKNKTQYTIGILCSLIGHLSLGVFVIIILESRAAEAGKAVEVFTVTLEGGEKLGGVTQIPDKLPEKPQKVPSAVHAEEEEVQEETVESAAEEEAAAEEVPEPEVESPSVIAEREKAAEEARLKAEAEKRLLEEKRKAEEKKKADEKKKAEEAKKRAEEEKKRKAEEAKQREIDRKKREEQARAARKKAFENRISQVRKGLNEKQYEGESYDAGGQGFGAARLGGKGTGGGTLASIQKVAYMNALEQHIKGGWRWIMGSQKLSALVGFRILRDGTLQNIELLSSSGNGNFDDSAIRAVRKASPVPPPPPEFYDDFSTVRLTFDSKE